MEKLTVVNQMLATLGETALAAITDSHEYLDDALNTLEDSLREVLSSKWWFNEETIRLEPNPIDQGLYLPGDTLEVISPCDGVVQRGNRLYQTRGGSFQFTSPMTVTLYRALAFEDLPETAAQYVSALAVLAFQTSFDGDSLKSQRLEQKVAAALVRVGSQETRNRKVILLDSNDRLARIRLTQRRNQFNYVSPRDRYR